MDIIRLMLILVQLILLNYLVSGTKHGHIWPHPQKIQMLERFWLVDPSQFQLISSNNRCDIIDTAILRYKTERFFIQDCSRLNSVYNGKYFHKNPFIPSKNDSNYLGILMEMKIYLNGKCETKPYLNMSESYQLTIGSNGIESSIRSSTVWGILRALETLSQLFRNIGPNQYRLNAVEINDYPRFPHRGLMIDTARHYLPLRSIYQTLDAMEMNKMNVLHWHMVDDQSFPFVSETYPQLSDKGAFNSETHIYTKKDIESVIEYAHLRAIRVIVEFDTPGHTKSWGKGLPQIVTKCYDKYKKPTEGRWGVLDLSQEFTFQVVEKLYREIVTRFSDQYIHLGGDEVDFQCWASNPSIQQFMKKMNFGNNYRQLESYYIKRLVKMVERLNRSYIVWQEVFDDNVTLQSDTVVHIWKGKDWQLELKKVTAKGYQALLSAPWYLNVISYGTDWTKYYDIEPLNFDPNEMQKKLVLGGEACMWSEWVDGSNLISRTWPRASAVAERLWSDAKIKSARAASTRFHEQHCRMQHLGLRVGPIDGPGYCACDYAL